MARAERLYRLADLLRDRDETTVGALADELGVSQRTILRDLATLRDQGMPIAGEAGPGGGIRLERNRRVATIRLSIAETVAISLAAKLSREASDLPWAEAANSALAKLFASLPRVKWQDLNDICRRVVIGPPAGVAIRSSAGKPPKELLSLFEEAFSGGIGLAFLYQDRDGKETNRVIEPHGLLVCVPLWYILAKDVEKSKPRMFRMDRISRPRLVRGVRFRSDPDVIKAQLPEPVPWRTLVGPLK